MSMPMSSSLWFARRTLTSAAPERRSRLGVAIVVVVTMLGLATDAAAQTAATTSKPVGASSQPRRARGRTPTPPPIAAQAPPALTPPRAAQAPITTSATSTPAPVGPIIPILGAGRGEKIALLKLPFQGLTAEVEGRLRGTLRDSLQRGGFSIVDEREIDDRLQRDPALASCATRSCFARLALMLGVRRVVEGTVQHPQRSSYSMKLQVRDLRSGQPVGNPVEERCDICSTEEAQQMVSRGADRLARSAPPESDPEGKESETGILHIESQPLNAEVLLDSVRQEDRTPAYFMLSVGVHVLDLSAPGHQTLHRSIEITPGPPVRLNLELIPVRPKRPWLTALSYSTLAAGVGLGITAGVLFAIDGQPVQSATCGPPAAGGDFACKQRWDTRYNAVGSAVGAGALLVTAGVLFYLDHRAPVRRTTIIRDR